MSTIAIVPVRGTGRMKTRIAEVLGAYDRYALVWVMLRRVLKALHDSGAVSHVVIVTRDREAVEQGIFPHARQSILQQMGHQDNLNGGIEEAVEYAGTRGASAIIMIPADLPLLTPNSVTCLSYAESDIAIVGNADATGTNAIRLSLEWEGAEKFRFHMGAGSFQHHFTEAIALGTVPEVLSCDGISHDLDTRLDWENLPESVQDDLIAEMNAFRAGDDD